MLKLLLCCTKAKPILYKSSAYSGDFFSFHIINGSKNFLDNFLSSINGNVTELNGKIVAECDYEVEEIKLVATPEYAGSGCNTFLYDVNLNFETETLSEEKLCEQSCINAFELDNYLDLYRKKEVYGYAIHIKNLHIFDKPRELSEYYTYSKGKSMVTYPYPQKIRKAPRNMMYAFKGLDDYALLPVSPEEMCRIANRQQTTLPRKRVLKEML